MKLDDKFTNSNANLYEKYDDLKTRIKIRKIRKKLNNYELSRTKDGFNSRKFQKLKKIN